MHTFADLAFPLSPTFTTNIDDISSEEYPGTSHQVLEGTTTVHGPLLSQQVSYPEHVLTWYMTSFDAVVLNGPRIFVPQAIYEPRAQRGQERYVSSADLNPPIIFCVDNSPEWGIPIRQLFSRDKSHLAFGDEPAFTACGPSICVRLNWPGYQPFHKRVLTRDYTTQRRFITKNRLAKLVAKCIKRFMDAMSQQSMILGSDQTWRVGPFGINVDDVILVSLHHVSRGSWQPQLRLRREIGVEFLA